jgi:hypothetical protein
MGQIFQMLDARPTGEGALFYEPNIFCILNHPTLRHMLFDLRYFVILIFEYHQLQNFLFVST